jgi:hypothetical protein
MTITRSAIATAFQHFLVCVDNAPEGTFVDAKEIRETIGDLADRLLMAANEHDLKVCNCDGIFNLEIEVYGCLRAQNEDRFLGAEGYGRAFDELDRDGQREMNRRLESDRDFLLEQDFIKGLDMMLATGDQPAMRS